MRKRRRVSVGVCDRNHRTHRDTPGVGWLSCPSEAKIKAGAERRLSGLHVTAVMMRSVAIPRAPLYIWEAAVLSMGMRERDREKRGWAHRWPLESGHAVTGRKRPLLAMPPFIPRSATLSRCDRGGGTSSLSVRRANSHPRDLIFIKQLF